MRSDRDLSVTLLPLGIGFVFFIALFYFKLSVLALLAAVLGAFIAFICFGKPTWAFFALVGTFGAEQLLGSQELLTATKLLGVLALVAWLFRAVLYRDYYLPRTTILIWGPGFFLTGLISLLAADDLRAGFLRLSTIFQLNVLAVLAATILSSRRELRQLAWVILISTLFSVMFGVRRLINDPVEGFEGMSGNRNSIGLFIAMCLPLIFYLFQRASTATRFALLVIAGVFLWAEALTYSRGGFIVAVTALVLSFLFVVRARKTRSFLIFGPLICLVIIFLPASYWDRVETIIPAITEGTDTVGLRYRLWGIAVRMIQDHPIVGVGAGNYPQNFAQYSGIQVLTREQALGTHNAYLEVMVEQGAVGTTVFLLLITAVLLAYYRCYAAARAEGREEVTSLVAAYGIGMIVFCIAGLKGGIEYYKYFWLLMGVAAGFVGLVFERPTSRESAETEEAVESSKA